MYCEEKSYYIVHNSFVLLLRVVEQSNILSRTNTISGSAVIKLFIDIFLKSNTYCTPIYVVILTAFCRKIIICP